ncbi:MAG: hypothetical protein FH749_02940 [Firmicutes bacterium]|nr:hypothetical protein [Bacillota bacterium]
MQDLHCHLENGPLNMQWLRYYIDQAKEIGLTELGISEHSHHFIEMKPLYYNRLDLSESTILGQRQRKMLKGYFKSSLSLYYDLLARARVSSTLLKLGLELDWSPCEPELIHELVEPWPVDYIIGSVHWLDGWCYDIWPDTWKGRNVQVVWEKYIDLCIEAVASGTFDILGHVDAIKIFGHYPARYPEEKWVQLAKTLASTGVTAEINPKLHYRGHTQHFCPDPQLLKIFYAHGVEICFGSDAHFPEDVGLMLGDAVDYAKAAGYTHYNSFTKRKKQALPLP